MSNKDDVFWDAYNELTRHITKEEAQQLMDEIDAYYKVIEEDPLNWYQVAITADAVHRRISFLAKKYSIPALEA